MIDVERIAAQVSELMRWTNVPGVSIALIETGQVSWTGAFGLQHRDADTPVGRDTVFQAASLSKPVFAAIVLRLAELGALGLDVPLSQYLDQPYVADDNLLHRVTARHVLSHTTGWPNWRAKGQPLRRDSAPGECFSYSGEGYVYLQHVIEHLTGEKLEALAPVHVFAPLRMPSSTFTWAAAHDSFTATGHDPDGAPTERHIGERPNAASSLHTTAADFARFVAAMLRPDIATWSIGSARVHEMLRPQVRINGRVSWGLGWGLESRAAGSAFWHWGDNPGYKSFAIGLPESQTGATVMTNGDGGRTLCGQIVQCALGTDHPALEWLASRYDGT